MRRTLPWCLTALVAAGAFAAALVGGLGLLRQPALAWVTQLPARSPSAWVARVLAATRAAATAELASTWTERLSDAVPASASASSPAFRPRTFAFQSSGAVDFADHRLEREASADGRFLERSVWIGPTLFDTQPRAHGPTHRVEGHVPVGLLGSFTYLEPYASYDPLATPSATVRVTTLGTGTVGGVPVWDFGLMGRSCGPTTPLPVVTVSVDHLGRLVQVRTVLRGTVPQPVPPAGSAPPPAQQIALAETTTLSDFGTPVVVHPPAASRFQPLRGGSLTAPNRRCPG